MANEDFDVSRKHSAFWQERFQCAGIHTALRRQKAVITAYKSDWKFNLCVGENVAQNIYPHYVWQDGENNAAHSFYEYQATAFPSE